MSLLQLLLILQSPSATPNPGDNNSLDLSNPFDIVVYIIAPIAILIFYILYLKQKKKGDNS